MKGLMKNLAFKTSTVMPDSHALFPVMPGLTRLSCRTAGPKKALLLFVLLVPLLVSSPIAAKEPQPKSKTGGITISPASQEIIVTADKKVPGGSFTVTNNNRMPETFTITAVDMGALDETGGLTFSGLAQDYQERYGLAKWLDLSRTQVAVKPGGKQTVAFTIKNDESLTPGGHYGAVIVRRAGETTVLPNQRVALSPQAASLLFLRKVGGERYGLSLTNLASDHSIWRMPTKATLNFRNDGNVHVVPRGVVRVRDALGREIAKGIINPESGLVLPERSRTFSVALSSQARVIWPGRYTVEAAYRHDGEERFTHTQQTFYTANLRILLLLLAALAVLIFAGYQVWRRRLWKSLWRGLWRVPWKRRPKFRSPR